MKKNLPQFHGSDLEAVAAFYHLAEDQIINYSSNVNPLGLSGHFRQSVAAHIECVCTYPDRSYTSLKQSISAYCHAPAEHLLIGSGATELISLFIKGIHPKKVLLVQPTYSEYEREIYLNGGTLDSFFLCEEQEFCPDPDALTAALTEDYDLLILCNPNNPTGTLWTPEMLRPVLSHCLAQGIMVLVDETYIEFTENAYKVNAIPLTHEFRNLFVIRGVSKFFAAPGLRLGYGITSNEELLNYICQSLNPWNVHSIAAVCGDALFEDKEFIARTNAFIKSERARIIKSLMQIEEIHMYPMSTNFCLLRILDSDVTSATLFDLAIRKGLMIRDCSSFPGLSDRHIRFCIQKPEANDRLIDFLKDVFSK